MKSNGTAKNHTDSLAAMLMFCAFALCVLFVLLLGAECYSSFTERDRVSFSVQNTSQYLYTKLRQVPSPESVTVKQFGDGDCLSIREDLGGIEVVTDVYCHDGWLCELFYLDDGGTVFAPEDGTRVLEADGMKLSMDAGLLKIVLTRQEGENIPVTFDVRGSEVAE